MKIEKPCILYYLLVKKDNKVGYKIGITTNTIKERYQAEKATVIRARILKIYPTESEAREEENRIKKKFKTLLHDQDILSTAEGNTELFITDILSKFEKFVKQEKIKNMEFKK